MSLLKEGLEQRAVTKTTLTRKLTIDGLTKAYPVYRVKLDWLFYNDQNDRIATWISQYKAQHNGQAPDTSDRLAYNDIIEEFIVASNPEAIRRTQTNIEMVDQREPGVVLADGRIVDGNRRFTCLRRLAKKRERFGFFEAVILNRNIEESAKEIKMLELSIQHGEESKVDYNPVDRLVGIYHDIVETNLLTIEEYASSTNEPESEVRRRVEIAKLMVEFLDFIKAPKQFYIARDLQISFPMDELLKVIKKCRDEKTIEAIKTSVFTNILMQTASDMVRFVRNFKSIIGSEYQYDFLEEQKKIAEQVSLSLADIGEMDTKIIREVIRKNDVASHALEQSIDKVLFKIKRNETRNRPIQLVEKAASFIESIDANILMKMNDAEKMKLNEKLDDLESLLAGLRTQI